MGCGQHKAADSVPPEKVSVKTDAPAGAAATTAPEAVVIAVDPSPANEETDVKVAESSIGEVETRASSHVDVNSVGGDASLRVDEIVEDALKEAEEKLALDDWFVVEKILMDAIESLQVEGEVGKAGIEKLKQSDVYKKVLKDLKDFEAVSADLLDSSTVSDGPEWKPAAEVAVDYAALNMHLSPEAAACLTKEDRVIKFFYRVLSNGNLQVRASTALPLHPANATAGKNTLTAWLALNLENDLAHLWHPIVHGDGPVMMTKRTKHRTFWQYLLKLLFMKQAQLEEIRHFMNPETGVIVTRAEQVPADDEATWAKYPPQSGFKKSPDFSNITVVCVPQEHTCYFTGFVEMIFKSPPPQFLLKILATWLFPEMIRRMLKATMTCLQEDGPYAPRLSKDEFGTYASSKECAAAGEKLHKSGAYDGKILGPRITPASKTVTNRSKSLTKFDAGAAL